MSKFYYGDRVRISNTHVSDGAYGTVVGEVRARGGYALTKENSNLNKESGNISNYLVKLDNISSAQHTIRGENCNYIWGHASENVDCILAKENELERCKTTFPKNIMLEFNGRNITAHGLEEHKKYFGKGDCFYSGGFDYELGCEIAIRNMFCQIAADQGFTGEAGYIDDANKIRIERFVDGYCVSNKSIEEQYYTVEAMEKDDFWHIVNREE